MKVKICAALSAALMLTACGSDNELTYISDTSETTVSESETTAKKKTKRRRIPIRQTKRRRPLRGPPFCSFFPSYFCYAASTNIT